MTHMTRIARLIVDSVVGAFHATPRTLSAAHEGRPHRWLLLL